MRPFFFPVLGLALFTLALAPKAHADDGESFSVSTKELGDLTKEENKSILGALKRRAVADYLRRTMGSRYRAVEAQVTIDFAERYIVDYAVNRPNPATPKLVVLSGHLDADSLRKWSRLADTKASGGPRPVFIVSSEISQLGWDAKQTASTIRKNSGGQALSAGFSSAFSKVGGRLQAADLPALSSSTPPVSPQDVQQLSEAAGAAGFNSALWVHAAPCAGCSGTKIEVRYYSFGQTRASLLETFAVPLEPPDFANADPVKKAFKKPWEDLSEKLADLLSKGTLQSAAHRLQVGLTSYRSFSGLYDGLAKLDYISQATLKQAGRNVAEFEILSSLGSAELAQRLETASFDNCRLKTRASGAAIEGRCGGADR